MQGAKSLLISSTALTPPPETSAASSYGCTGYSFRVTPIAYSYLEFHIVLLSKVLNYPPPQQVSVAATPFTEYTLLRCGLSRLAFFVILPICITLSIPLISLLQGLHPPRSKARLMFAILQFLRRVLQQPVSSVNIGLRSISCIFFNYHYRVSSPVSFQSSAQSPHHRSYVFIVCHKKHRAYSRWLHISIVENKFPPPFLHTSKVLSP